MITGLLPEDTKIESISSFSERGLLGLGFFFRRKRKISSRLNKRKLDCRYAYGTGLLSRMVVFSENCFSEQNTVVCECLLRLLRVVTF